MSVTDEDVIQYNQIQDKEYIHGQLAMEVAWMQGIFPGADNIWDVDKHKKDVNNTTIDVDLKLAEWQLQLEKLLLVSIETPSSSDEPVHQQFNKPTVLSFSNLKDMSIEAIGQSVNKGLEQLTSTDVTNLNNDQQ
jgi:hypothetical protein